MSSRRAIRIDRFTKSRNSPSSPQRGGGRDSTGNARLRTTPPRIGSGHELRNMKSTARGPKVSGSERRKGLNPTDRSAAHRGPIFDGDAAQRFGEEHQQAHPAPPEGQPPARGEGRRGRRPHEHGPRGHGGDEGRAGPG